MWGREQGRAVYEKLVSAIDRDGGRQVVKISMKGVEQMNASFASEAIVELMGRYRRTRGICLTDVADKNIQYDIDVAADRAKVPVTVWDGAKVTTLGLKPSAGNREALDYALGRAEVRAASFAEANGLSIANASTKFKQLWEQGFLMRREGAADSGGVEFLYSRIG